jgi:hypothetical protein
MPGDVPRGFLGDVAVTGRWGHRGGQTFVGTGLGLTLPTGKVIAGVGVRGGRGALGMVLDGSALRMLVPVLGLAGRVAWTQSLYAGPGEYLVGPQLDVALGAIDTFPAEYLVRGRVVSTDNITYVKPVPIGPHELQQLLGEVRVIQHAFLDADHPGVVDLHGPPMPGTPGTMSFPEVASERASGGTGSPTRAMPP